MNNSKDEIISQLKSEKLTICSDASLYETMVIKQGYYSLTPAQLDAKKTHHQSFINEARHIDHKLNSVSCLSCEKVLTCSFKNQCKID